MFPKTFWQQDTEITNGNKVQEQWGNSLNAAMGIVAL